MRLWTLHPMYLDAAGLTAVWREALLAQKVLRGETKGYRNHPQLIRFKAQADPLSAISQYLTSIFEESIRRGYRFNKGRIGPLINTILMEETQGQLLYEWGHLKSKLALRDPELLERHQSISMPLSHPLFKIVPGNVRAWEKIKASR
jgi:hypothetical protein